jgi:dienelactone hydrolase
MAPAWISILVDGQDMRADRSQPETTGELPSAIVVLETFGVNKHIQKETDELRRAGYGAVALGLYHHWGSNL